VQCEHRTNCTELMAPSMQASTLIQHSKVHPVCITRRSRPFVSNRGSSGRLQIHAVAVRDASSERRPALLAGSRHAGGVHSDKKKVLIVGAGWAGAGSTSGGPWGWFSMHSSVRLVMPCMRH
jgi:hypothetical protein